MLKLYNKKYNLSYTFGVSPTIELLEKRSGDVVKIVINPKGMRNEGMTKILNLCKKLNIPIEKDKKTVEKLTESENIYTVAVFKKYETKLNAEKNHIILVNPSDMGNLGTICRTMLAFDFTDLAVISPAVDIFNPKVVRASMGAVFSLNFKYYASFEEYLSEFKRNIYTFMCDGAIELNKAQIKAPFSFVFGNEGEGLDPRYKNTGTSIKIHQNTKVDSLNLAVAVGIALYNKQRLSQI